MNNLIPKNVKVEVIALGCGKEIPNMFMGEGSSEWLDSISILYSKEVIDNLIGGTRGDIKYVSKEMTEAIVEVVYGCEDRNRITVILTGSLGSTNQRVGRVNQCYMAIIDQYGEVRYYHEEFDSTLTREEQEVCVVNMIHNYLVQLNTTVWFCGSFDPPHAGHKHIYDATHEMSLALHPPIVEVTSHHPVKGLSSGDEFLERVKGVSEYFDAVTLMSSDPKFIDKYNSYKLTNPHRNLIFLIGSDVWDNIGESLMEDFHGIHDVKFLIFSRFNNRNAEDFVDWHPLIHPLSFTVKMPEELLGVSSTKIRKENEEV